MILFFLLNAASASLPVNADSIAAAKKLLLQGSRVEAIQMLDRLKNKVKSKKETEEIAGKRSLFLEQFMTSDNYQNYHDAKLYSQADQWADCLRKLGKVTDVDQNNKSFLFLRGYCLKSNSSLEAAEKDFLAVQDLDSEDVASAIELLEIWVQEKNTAKALALAEKVKPTQSELIEKHVILKSRLLMGAVKEKDAIELLRKDHETYLDHISVLYELAGLYEKQAGGEWFARKYYSLFVTRCKRLAPEKLKEKRLEKACTAAQGKLLEIEKRLGSSEQS